MHITPEMLKNYSFYSFLNRSNFLFASFQKKVVISKIVYAMFMFPSWRLNMYLNSASNVFAYLLIIFLGHDWFGFFINEDAIVMKY